MDVLRGLEPLRVDLRLLKTGPKQLRMGLWLLRMVLPQPKVGQNLPDFLGMEAQCLAGWTVEPSAQLSECLAGWAVEPSVCLPECWGQAKTHSEAV